MTDYNMTRFNIPDAYCRHGCRGHGHMTWLNKTSRRFQPLMILSCLALTMSACTKAQLVRFAPPGILKYEELAGDVPINPEIQTRIDERDDGKEKPFPLISNTPAAVDGTKNADQQQIMSEDLEDAKVALDQALEEDRTAALNERSNSSALTMRREDLEKSLEREAAIAERERRGPRPTPLPVEN